MKIVMQVAGSGILCGILRVMVYLLTPSKVASTELILAMNVSAPEITLTNMVDMTIQFFPYLVFEILCSSLIYRQYCTTSIYFFTRCSKRTHWLAQQAFHLFLLAVLYELLFFAVGVVLTMGFGKVVFQIQGLWLMLASILLGATFLSFFTLLINLISIYATSSSGVLLVVALELLGILSICLFDQKLPLILPDGTIERGHVALFRCTPMAQIVMQWHDFNMGDWNWAGSLGVAFSYWWSIGYYLLANMILLFAGFILVKRKIILINDMECEG